MALPSRKSFKKVERAVFLVGYYEQPNINIYLKYVACKKTNSVWCQTLVWVSYLEALTIDCLL